MDQILWGIAKRWYRWHLKQRLIVSIPLILAQGLAVAIFVPLIVHTLIP